MICKTCGKTFRLTNNIHPESRKICEEFSICRTCRRQIAKGKVYTKKTGENHTKCVICGRDINHSNLAPTCTTGGCRAIWYRIEADKKRIETYIETNDFDDIEGLSVVRIHDLGYKITLSLIPSE